MDKAVSSVSCEEKRLKAYEEPEPKAPEPEELEPGKPRKWRLTLRTLSAFFGYLAMGAALSILGPTLVSMEVLHNTDTAGISWAIISQNIGGLFGAVLCGVFLERYNPEFQLGMACFLGAVAMAIAPFTGHLYGFIALFVFLGISIGFLDSGSMPYLMRLWEGSLFRNTVLHAMSPFSSVGRFLTPLIIRDLLYITEDTTFGSPSGCSVAGKWKTNVSHTNFTNVPNLDLNTTQSHIYYNDSLKASDSLNLNSSLSTFSQLHVNPQFNVTDMAQVKTTRYAYLVVSLIPLVGAILYSVSFFVNKGLKSFIVRSVKAGKTSGTKSTKRKDKSLGVRVGLLVICCLFMVNHSWLVNMPGAFLSSFAIKGLCMDVKTGSVLTSVYMGFHGIGRLLTIIVSRWLKPRQMLIILFSFYATGMVCGLFIPLHPRLVWATAVFAGIGASSMYFSSLLWFSNFIRITGRISAMCISSISFGGMVGPLFIGNMFQTYGHMWLIYIQTGTLLWQCFLMCVVEIMARVFKIEPPSYEEGEQVVVAEEMKNLKEDKC